MRPILDIARERLGIPPEHVEPYGHYKAKIDGLRRSARRASRTASSSSSPPSTRRRRARARPPRPSAWATRSTASARRRRICLREPSLGPCFGMKGGAAGGGYSQVVPMDEINLHFTGDFHAIGVANNLLAAMIDNHIYWGNALGIDPRRVTWRRCLDMNDRALRQIVSSLGGVANGFPREDGFDITVASEVMAILCLSTSSRRSEAAPRQHRRRPHARPQAGARQRPEGARRDDRAAQGRASSRISCRRWRTIRPSCMAARSPTSPMAATRCWRRSWR